MNSSRQNSINSRVWDFLYHRAQQQHGRVYLDTGQIISTLARRFPSEARPRVYEVMHAIDYLRRAGKVRSSMSTGYIWVSDDKTGHKKPPENATTTQNNDNAADVRSAAKEE